ncbi:MAG: transposase [Bacteroidetes bacterium]|nr:transposase [Bacteroidota bacterium]
MSYVKHDEAIEDAQDRILKTAQRKKKKSKDQTLRYARYVILFTTFPADKYSEADVLEWYRLRWQVELVFKRFKSLAQLGHLPKMDDENSQAWLYGKLMVALLTEKMVRHARTFSPGDTRWKRSEWNDFKFVQNQILRTIEPYYSLNEMIENRGTISKSLIEPPRRRNNQIEKYSPIHQTS